MHYKNHKKASYRSHDGMGYNIPNEMGKIGKGGIPQVYDSKAVGLTRIYNC